MGSGKAQDTLSHSPHLHDVVLFAGGEQALLFSAPGEVSDSGSVAAVDKLAKERSTSSSPLGFYVEFSVSLLRSQRMILRSEEPEAN